MVTKQNQAYNYGLIGKFKAVNHLNNYSNRLIINFSFGAGNSLKMLKQSVDRWNLIHWLYSFKNMLNIFEFQTVCHISNCKHQNPLDCPQKCLRLLCWVSVRQETIISSNGGLVHKFSFFFPFFMLNSEDLLPLPALTHACPQWDHH